MANYPLPASRNHNTNLLGATNATLVLTNVNFAASGSYSVVVSNAFGSVLSSNAQLTVLPALITTQPERGTANSAILSGLVTPGLNDTVVWFEWGTNSAYGNTTPATDVGESLSQLNVSALLNSLTPYTLYHYQAVASNSFGIVFGGDVSFETVPLFVRTSATNINWNGVACSADGKNLAAISSGGGIWTSADYGDSWTQTSAPYTNWARIVSSADGTKLAAIAGSMIYTTTNSGGTWSSNSTPTGFSYIASSADGNRLVASGGSHVYTSVNAGATWTQTSAPSSDHGFDLTWTSVASSADGTKLACSVYVHPRSGLYYTGAFVSTNSGINWNQVSGWWYDDYSLLPVTLSASGDKIAVSIDSLAIVSSADGAILAVLNGGYFLTPGVTTSMDSGVTWASASVPPNLIWNCLALSADGNELIAGANKGIYISRNTAMPKLQITTSTNLALSWSIPSSNVVLQQSSDLSKPNWINVIDTPALDATNWRAQVWLPLTASNGFFRLKSP